VVVLQAKAAGDVRRRNGGPVTQRENAVDFAIDWAARSHRFQDFVRCGIRRFEVNGNGTIAPWIVKLVASVGDKRQIDAKFLRCFVEAPRLVA
jgi:hypothetical protein